MKFNKTICGIVFASIIFLTGCGNNNDNGVLVIYTPLWPDFSEPLVEMFEQETGINVELLSMGTGELLARINAEADNPQADIMWSGALSTLIPSMHLFENITSSNETSVLPMFANAEGPLTRFTFNGYVLVKNTEVLEELGVTINGYADLLNPALRGRIAMLNPAFSATAFNHLINMIHVMGETEEEGWAFVEALMDNVDGVMLMGGGALMAGVAAGEYAVGITFESGPMPFIEEGAPVEIVYMEEGVVFIADGVLIVNNAPNRDNAQIFVDFMTSYTVQSMIENELFSRSVRADVAASPGPMLSLDYITITDIPLQSIVDNRDKWLERFREIWEG